MQLWLIAIVAIFVGGCQPPPSGVAVTGRTMGTTWTVRLGHCPQSSCEQELAPLIRERLQELNQVFSHYDRESELSNFNAHSGTDWFPVSPDMATVIQLAADVSRLSDGAFDITVATAVDAWGFGAVAHDGSLPDAELIDQAFARTGYQLLAVRENPPALQKSDPLVRIDTSAIAKGYAVDQLAYLLEREGIRDYLVDIGGELRTSGARADGRAWRIGIESPNIVSNTGPAVEFVVIPGNKAVATSGDYRNFYMQGERRISHTINPATATPLDDAVAAVSVIAPSAAQADALATALLVMGPDAGMALAERKELAVLFRIRKNGRLTAEFTPAFAEHLLKK